MLAQPPPVEVDCTPNPLKSQKAKQVDASSEQDPAGTMLSVVAVLSGLQLYSLPNLLQAQLLKVWLGMK